ncbi:hypothetical protein [Sphingopyxis sp. KK2]|uniref:hypothetical protein n=1 Tax=Sphingopyxis sp. KK2 TaxID=1855727 RepID=UPI001181BB14|nr:hypothetical protein [Sphingopyxis sp. KK2]
MTRKPALFFLLAAMVAATLFLGTPTRACACIGPMPEDELRALIRKADKGDIRATGQVWQEYAFVREDARRAKMWGSRAIRAGDPDAMEDMADRWMWEGQRTKETRYKLVFYDAAVRLLENGYRNRNMLAACDAAGMNERYFYVANLRSARAALETAKTGPQPWIRRANMGDAVAAYQVANHYFWVNLNQDLRSQWENRASELGDVFFAGNSVRPTSDAQQIRDISHALAQKHAIAKLGDRWVQTAVVSELTDRLVQTRHFASGKKGRPSGLICASSFP